jgi:hypothetical protein
MRRMDTNEAMHETEPASPSQNELTPTTLDSQGFVEGPSSNKSLRQTELTVYMRSP